MRGIERNGQGELTLLELLLHLEGTIRRRLEPIRVTPRQAGALLFLHRHAEATLTDAAMALGVRLRTMSTVVTALVPKGGSPSGAQLRVTVSCVYRLVGGARL